MTYTYHLKIFIISIFINFTSTLYSLDVQGQIFDSEQNPPGIKWQEISTENFQVLYPAELKVEAQRMANTLEHLIAGVSEGLGRRPRKITIILQNQGVVSNGFVQLAPRRSEFFTVPPQSFDMQDWLNSLAVHELRHIVQFDKLAGKLSKPLFEELALVMFGVTLPPWFFEGDAVGIETALTHAGRGRLPEWEMIFRTNTLSGKRFSYSKNYLGSLKDLTPGYYQLGYFMTSKLKRDYGKGIIDTLMTEMSRKLFRPYNLSKSIKNATGLNTRNLHDSTVVELTDLWGQQVKKTDTREYPIINERTNKIPADFLLPVRINSDEILVLKRSLSKTPSIVKINNSGKETELLKIGFQTESNFSYSAGKIVWDEFRYDKRYQKRSFNVINIYDLENHVYKQLTHKTRLFSPALSPDSKLIAAVKIDLSNRSEIIELDSQTGEEIQNYKNVNGYILQTPSFNKDGNRVVCVAVSANGSALVEYNRLDGSQKIILDFQWQQLSRPVYAGERILFRAHYNGITNLYSINGSTISQLTWSKFGASNARYDDQNNLLLFNNYQNLGHDIATQPIDKISEVSISDRKSSFINYAAPLVLQESDSTLLDNVPRKEYKTERYSEFRNLFYFHSLSPIAEENEFNDQMNVGFKLKSNNQLNTMDFYTGYQFNTGQKQSEYLAGFTYKRFYPVLNVSYINRARLSSASLTQSGTTTIIPVNWRENFAEMEISIPFVANRLNKNFLMGFSTSSSFTSRYQITNRPARFTEKIRFPLQYQLYFNYNSQRSTRDLAPKWGQNISFSYQSLPFDKSLSGEMLRLQTSIFTPGLFTNHSLQSSFNYQKGGGIYQFNIDIPRVSGYSNLNTRKVRNTLLFDYRMPLFYPDMEIGDLAYLKRVRAGLFADFENIGKGNTFRPTTYGLELNGDMNLLRFYLPTFVLSGKLILVTDKTYKSPIFEFGFNYNL